MESWWGRRGVFLVSLWASSAPMDPSQAVPTSPPAPPTLLLQNSPAHARHPSGPHADGCLEFMGVCAAQSGVACHPGGTVALNRVEPLRSWLTAVWQTRNKARDGHDKVPGGQRHARCYQAERSMFCRIFILLAHWVPAHQLALAAADSVESRIIRLDGV